MFETIRKNPEVAKAIAENLKVEINKIDSKNYLLILRY